MAIPKATAFARKCITYHGTPYKTLDCQGLPKKAINALGGSASWAGTNDMWRNKVHDKKEFTTFNEIPVGAILFVCDFNDLSGLPAKYNNQPPDCKHCGIYIGNEIAGSNQPVIHSTAGGVQYWKEKSNYPSKWTHWALLNAVDYSDSVTTNEGSADDWIAYETRYLGTESQQHNAKLIAKYFVNQGWTLNAIAGMLGNMQTESTINPKLWEGRSIPTDPLTASKGYGLTQWTPARKLIIWANENNLDYSNGYTQCARIQYECDNNLQWSLDNYLRITFPEYIISTESPETLARVFLWAYERPSNPDVNQRQTQARNWYNWLLGQSFENMPTWLYFIITQNGKRVKHGRTRLQFY